MSALRTIPSLPAKVITLSVQKTLLSMETIQWHVITMALCQWLRHAYVRNYSIFVQLFYYSIIKGLFRKVHRNSLANTRHHHFEKLTQVKTRERLHYEHNVGTRYWVGT